MSAPTDADRDLNDLMAVAYEQGREDERANLETGKPVTVYMCDRCGFLSYGSPPEIEPGDPQGEPDLSVQCPCYMGPRWVRGVWRREKASATSEVTMDEGQR